MLPARARTGTTKEVTTEKILLPFCIVEELNHHLFKMPNASSTPDSKMTTTTNNVGVTAEEATKASSSSDVEVPPAIPMKIRYNGDIVYTFQDIHQVTSRCSYFDSLVNRWLSEGVDTLQSIHDIPMVHPVGSSAVQIVLQTLDKNEFPPEEKIIQEESNTTGYPFRLHEQIIEFAFYLGCDDYFLPIFCINVKSIHKQRVAQYLCQQNKQSELQTLMYVETFFDGFDKSMIPLQQQFCFNFKMAIHLIKAYKTVPDQSLYEYSWNILSSIKKYVYPSMDDIDNSVPIPTPIQIDHFGLLTIHKFANYAKWSSNDFDVIFSILPTTGEMNQIADEFDSTLKNKPEGLELLLSRAILLHKNNIPRILRYWDGIDITLIAPALFEADEVPTVIDYPDPERTIRTIVESWTVEDCLTALKENRGGIRSLFEDAVTDEDCDWLARIPIFHEACHKATEGSTIQHLLYRRFFLHREFDSNLSPSLLSCLPALHNDHVGHRSSNSSTSQRRIREKALEHAVLYLEKDGSTELAIEQLDPILPWSDANRQLTERVSSVLRNDDSVIWKRIDISKLHGSRFLDYVPAKVLSRLAYEEALDANKSLRDHKKRIKSLEDTVKKLKNEIENLEKEQKRQKLHEMDDKN